MEWVEHPPPIERKGRRVPVAGRTYHDEVEAMRQNPGKWCLLDHRETRFRAGVFAQQIRSGDLTSFRPGKFDAVSRQTAVYVRYLGEDW